MHDYLKIAGFLFAAVGMLAIVAAVAGGGSYAGDRALLVYVAVGGIFGGFGWLYAGFMLENASVIRRCQERQTEIIEKLYANSAVGRAEK